LKQNHANKNARKESNAANIFISNVLKITYLE
jgi:hypothetical protein